MLVVTFFGLLNPFHCIHFLLLFPFFFFPLLRRCPFSLTGMFGNSIIRKLKIIYWKQQFHRRCPSLALVTLGSDSRLLSEEPGWFKAVWSCSFSLTPQIHWNEKENFPQIFKRFVLFPINVVILEQFCSARPHKQAIFVVCLCFNALSLDYVTAFISVFITLAPRGYLEKWKVGNGHCLCEQPAFACAWSHIAEKWPLSPSSANSKIF